MERTLIRVENIRFSSVQETDFEELLALRIAAMRESLEKIGRFDQQRARDRFLDSFSPNQTRHILLDGAKAGFFALKPLGGELLLDHLYVHPDYQCKGIGAITLRHIFAEKNPDKLPIRVGALRESDSNRFYIRYGFEKIEEWEWDIYYVRSFSAVN